MKRKIATLFSALILMGSAYSQRNCGTNEYQQNLELNDPSIIRNREEIEEFTRTFIANYSEGERVNVTIPVVVHIVWNTTTENISDAQIQSQLTVLNNDFRRLNADVANTPSAFSSLTADANINFCLATTDPNGNATNGIVRVQTAVTAFGTNDQVKSSSTGGSNAWDRNRYLNIWVCDISGGILGYAQFPGGTASTDGVVIDYQYFGTTGTATAPFNKGRTGTHEVGHWLNLYHIWGDDGTGCTGSDLVSDTPNQGSENYGCPVFPKVSCSNGPNGDMFMNYMDYTDDACMFMFSTGQAARMQALFSTGGARASLLTSNGCGTPTPVTCGNISGLSVGSIAQTSATVSWTALSGATGYTVQYKPTSATTFTSVEVTTTSYSITGLTAGTAYNVQVRANCSAGNGPFTATTFTTTSSTPACSDNYESNNTSSAAKTIPVNTNIVARISTSTDKDWFRFSNTSTARNIRIDLTNLPADYDVRLYNPSGTQVAISQNGGTTAEVINYNTTTTGTWRVQVYGYNGAFNSSLCYTLRASISSTAFREDGSNEEEPTANLIFNNDSPITLANAFPNPTSGKLNLQFNSEKSEVIQILISDVTGRWVSSQSFTATEGTNFTTLDLLHLENGTYQIILTDGVHRASSLIIKQ
jgi:hypothetical protein